MEEFTKLRDSFLKEAEIYSEICPMYNKTDPKKSNPLKNPLKILEPSSKETIKEKLKIRETLLDQYKNRSKFRKINPAEDIRLELNDKFFLNFLGRFNRKLRNADTWYLQCLDEGNDEKKCGSYFVENLKNYDQVMKKELKERMFLF